MGLRFTLLMRMLAKAGFVSAGPPVTSISSATQNEGTSLVHTVTLASAVNVIAGRYPFNITSVTASTPSDYSVTPTFSNSVTLSGNTLIVPVGVSGFTVTVPTSQDTIYEGTETYSISVGGMVNTGTITDDETAITITSVSGVSATEGSNLVHTVNLSGVAQSARTYPISIVGVTATESADFTNTLVNGMFSNGVTLSGANVSVPPGVTSFTITISTTNDLLVEGTETYTLTVGGLNGTGTITDNDFNAPNISSISSETGNEATNLVYTVVLSTAVTGGAAVYPFSLSNITATSPSDYTTTPTFSDSVTISSGNISVPIGVSTFTVTVPTVQNSVYEATETYSVTINGVTATGTITDDDSAPVIASVSSASAVEGFNISHTVVVTGTAQAARTFALTLSGGTASSVADYTGTLTDGAFSNGVTISSGNISVPPGVTTFTVLVPTASDILVEGNETYTLTIGGASGTGTILDEDTVTPGFTVLLDNFTNATGSVTTEANINVAPGFTTLFDNFTNAIGSVATNAFITGVSSGLITPVVNASRDNGSGNLVAPLLVFFDASATTSSLTTRPFHDLEYRWDFGDGNTSTWAYGAQAGAILKRIAFGPSAAYVYETAGTWTPSLQVRYRMPDGSFVVETQAQPAITVTSAAYEWTTTKTVCYSTNTDFTGAPSGCVQVPNVTDFATSFADNKGAGNKRHLLHVGQTFTSTNLVSVNVGGGANLVGSFGSGAKPIVTVSTPGAPVFGLSSTGTPTGVSDWRFQDLAVDGVLDSVLFNGSGSCKDMLVHRCDLSNTIGSISLSGSQLGAMNSGFLYQHQVWDNFGLVESTINNLRPGLGANGLFLTCRRFAALGSFVDTNGGGEHGIRTQFIDRGVFSHLTIQGIVDGKHNLTVRGPGFTASEALPAGNYTEKVIISDNKIIGGNNSELMTVAPQNTTANERGRNYLIERNWFVGSSTIPNYLIKASQQDITIRNNVAYLPGNNGGLLVNVKCENDLSAHLPTRVHAYNNTLYIANTTASFSLITTDTQYGNLVGSFIESKNNIVYGPSASNANMLYNPTAATVTASNNTSNINTNPLFAATPPVALADFKIGVGSYTNGTGTITVNICSDFYGNDLNYPVDMGSAKINVESVYRDAIPKIIGIPTVGTPIAYLSARLTGSPAATATRIRVGGTTVASGTTTASYSPVLADAAKMLTVEVDYGATATVSMPMPILSDEWMIPVPVTWDSGIALTSDSQPGTNIYYIDPVGGVGPNLIQAYGWNGTNIIDSTGSTTGVGGVSYGTDPLNPSGPVVAGKHSSAVFLDRYGNLPGVRDGFGNGYGPGEGEYTDVTNRRGSSQWYLIKRGTTLDLGDDLVDYKVACTSLGATCEYTTNGLATSGGQSWAARQVIGAYGSLSTARPVITQRAGIAANPIVGRNDQGHSSGSWSNVQYMDLVFNGKIRNGNVNPVQGFAYIGGTVGENVWATGCLITGCMNIPVQSGSRQFMFYRSMITDAFYLPGGGHCQGIFSSGLNRGGKMQLLETFMAHNGFKCDPARIRDGWDSIPAFNSGSGYAAQDLVLAPDGKVWLSVSSNAAAAWTGGPYPANTGWILAGVNRQPVAADVFCRNNYWSAGMSPTESFAIRCVLLPGATGEQISRGGSRVESNLMLTGYSSQGGGGGYAGTSSSGGIIDNVIFPYADGGQNPGWSTGLSMGAGYVKVSRNIVSRQATSGGAGFTLASVAWESSGFDYIYPVRNNLIEFNIFDSGSAAPLSIEDGYRGGTSTSIANYGAGPGVLNNSMSNNWLITSNGAFSSYSQTTGGPATDITSTIATGNVTYATRAAAATALGGVDSTRDIRTYLTSIGQTVPGTDIYGVNTWISLWELQRRGNWNSAITAVPAINYVRAGFGMPLLTT